MSKLAASLLAADVLHLGEGAQLAQRTGCDYLHLDIMDGNFVPNLSFGPHLLGGLQGKVDIVRDCHLMLARPLPFVDVFAKHGADGITVHVEAEDFEACLARIEKWGITVGASCKPATPAEALVPYFDRLQRILVMTVEPGFGGQQLMDSQVRKIRRLRSLGFTGEIEVDGGITLQNAPSVVAAGADTLVMGTSFYAAEDPQAVVAAVHALSRV